jgi:hypothetical protein
MPPKQLVNLEKIGKLKVEFPAKTEFDGLVRSGSARLKDSTYSAQLDIDNALVEALIRVAKEIEKRVCALKPLA